MYGSTAKESIQEYPERTSSFEVSEAKDGTGELKEASLNPVEVPMEEAPGTRCFDFKLLYYQISKTLSCFHFHLNLPSKLDQASNLGSSKD